MIVDQATGLKRTMNTQWGENAVRKCLSKLRYTTPEAAEAACVESRAHKRFTPPKLRAYRCRVCSYWHVTSQPMKLKEAA